MSLASLPGLYVLPVDVDLADVEKLPPLFSSSALARAAADAGRSLLVLDCCRNNPADGWQQKQAEDQSLVRGTDQEGFVSRNACCWRVRKRLRSSTLRG